jgi:hypothetical protein
LGSKNGLERRVWQFYIICDKNQLLKVTIDKVTVILVPRSDPGVPAAGDIGLCGKFCMGLYGAISKK